MVKYVMPCWTTHQKCYLCSATSRHFNNIDKILNKEISTSKCHFGISPLHGWIRSFECLLNLGYKLVIKQWQARGAENKSGGK